MSTAQTASSVPTVASLRRTNRLIARRRRAADRVTSAMRNDGLALHCSFEKSETRWWLSNGSRVSPEAAKLVTTHPDINNAGDGLFRCPGQTFRIVE
jgi:hypothetical protein